ncbi:MAG: hypothetical protein JWS10_2176 [Cypionkella sp.]|uniref:HK97-gp10 family putative phage morphogenesis protein n=1 Tax=Cypionkella sp. TaxID=2811411 RepID=UPI00260717D4|nr:HK97-gp10 family putative phage morphogenesis protein [Cypionkella sp.]MDB5659561.1 hypothetical protein [Cypionkella sp.]
MASQSFDLAAQSRALAKRLEAIPAEIVAHVRPALIASAEELAATMKALAPQDEGDLIASIAVTAPGQTTPPYAAGGGKRTAAENEALVTVGNPDMRHGHLQEFGTVNHEAQPFMRPAERLTRAKFKARIGRAVGAAIRAAAKAGGATDA